MRNFTTSKTVVEINSDTRTATIFCKPGSTVSAYFLASMLNIVNDEGAGTVLISGLDSVYFSCDGSAELMAELLTKRVPDTSCPGGMMFRRCNCSWEVEKDGSKGVFSAQYVANMANEH